MFAVGNLYTHEYIVFVIVFDRHPKWLVRYQTLDDKFKKSTPEYALR